MIGEGSKRLGRTVHDKGEQYMTGRTVLIHVYGELIWRTDGGVKIYSRLQRFSAACKD